MSDFDRILMCPSCETRQNFNFGGSGKVGACMVCGYEVSDARFGTQSARIIQSLAAIALDEYQSEQRLKRRLSKELYDILHKEE